MRSYFLLLGAFLPLALACDNPLNDVCAAAIAADNSAAKFCATYTAGPKAASAPLPSWASSGCQGNSRRISSACSCLGSPASSTFQTVPSASASKSINSAAAQTTSSLAVTSLSKAVHAPSLVPSISASAAATNTNATATFPFPTLGPQPGNVLPLPAPGAACTVTAAAGIPSAVASCSNIVLSNVAMPAGVSLDLTKLKAGSTVFFAGSTTFAKTANSDFDPVIITGNNLTITGAAGHSINGNGPAYWDGCGSNCGSPKPDHFIVLNNMHNSIVSNLNVTDWPTHCFDVTSSDSVTITGLRLDNSDGDNPNAQSGGKPAAHNTDGFDIATSTNIIVSDTTVINQDDCVAITSGSNITITRVECVNGHGLSVGSIGGKSDNIVTGVVFSDSIVKNSANGCRVKTNVGTTGSITGLEYTNITLQGITEYAIVVQQDYSNLKGETGNPTNGVRIADLNITDVAGTMSKGTPIKILCGEGSCANFDISGVSIQGGTGSTCNYPSTGCPV